MIENPPSPPSSSSSSPNANIMAHQQPHHAELAGGGGSPPSGPFPSSSSQLPPQLYAHLSQHLDPSPIPSSHSASLTSMANPRRRSYNATNTKPTSYNVSTTSGLARRSSNEAVCSALGLTTTTLQRYRAGSGTRRSITDGMMGLKGSNNKRKGGDLDAKVVGNKKLNSSDGGSVDSTSSTLPSFSVSGLFPRRTSQGFTTGEYIPTSLNTLNRAKTRHPSQEAASTMSDDGSDMNGEAAGGSGVGGYTDSPVPLTVSSLAHLSGLASRHTFQSGVEDGIREVISHTLNVGALNYVRAMYPHRSFTVRDIVTTNSDTAWKLMPTMGVSMEDVPTALRQVGFNFLYERNCVVYLSPGGKEVIVDGDNYDVNNWQAKGNAIARFKLCYGAAKPLTEAETRTLNEQQHEGRIGSEDGGNAGAIISADSAESSSTNMPSMPLRAALPPPPLILWRMTSEYRTLPPVSPSEISSEELSMLSLGGTNNPTADNDPLKYGALSSLHDTSGRFAFEIATLHGRTYKFDLMDMTLANGTVPRSQLQHGKNNTEFAKKKQHLCVKVTSTEPDKYVQGLTRMSLTLDGPLKPGALATNRNLYRSVLSTFRTLNPRPSPSVSSGTNDNTGEERVDDDKDVAIGATTRHALLLHPSMSSRIYVNGRFLSTWGTTNGAGDNAGIGTLPQFASHYPSLFGLDLLHMSSSNTFASSSASSPPQPSHIEGAYSQLLQEVLIDANQSDKNFAGRLLNRLMYGHDDDIHQDDSPLPQTPCLESHIMSNPNLDPIGLSAKALATNFRARFGTDAFPCLPADVHTVQDKLGGLRIPIPVSQRALDVLRRGGYCDIGTTESESIWKFGSAYSSSNSPSRTSLEDKEAADHSEGTNAAGAAQQQKHEPDERCRRIIVEESIRLLQRAGCTTIKPSHIIFVNKEQLGPNPVGTKLMCRYNPTHDKFFVNDSVLTMPTTDERNNTPSWSSNGGDTATRAYMLGLFVAREHPDGNVLVQYFMNK